jgi:hypothetical protein
VFVSGHGLTEPVSAVLGAFTAVLRAGFAVLAFVGHAESVRAVRGALAAVLGTGFAVLAGDAECVPAFQRTQSAVLPAVLAVLVRIGTQPVAAVYRTGTAVIGTVQAVLIRLHAQPVAAFHRTLAAVGCAVQAVLGEIAETVSAQPALGILADAVGIVGARYVRDRLGTRRKRQANRQQSG